MRSKENREYVKYHYYYPPFVSSVLEGSPAERFVLAEELNKQLAYNMQPTITQLRF